ncbi:MAG: apolipoprotein N-acyltransferase [Gammaproteobacteria bacterium]|jgi:apolipoprotein N-acyltransferase|nr:apolipoprotein N-acyltransferase [Gammaproteobacteria bacterium]
MRIESGLSTRFVLLMAPLAGALITLSLAPFNVWPAGIASCALYSYLLCTCSARQALWRGWLFGAGLFGTGVSWVYVSIHVHGNAGIPLAVALTALFCAALALLHALFAWCYVRFVRPLPGGMLVGFPALWVLFEWLRDWFLTGFPWLYLGYAHIDTWIAGWAPVTGVFGLSFIVALTGSCLFLAWRSRRLVAWATYAVAIITVWGGGAILKPTQWVARATEEPLRVAIVQPDVAQENKWNRAWYRPILQQLEDATEPLLGYDIIVWPESAVPNYYQRAQDFLQPMAQRASEARTTIITGIPYSPVAGGEYYNSIAALGFGQGVYHKQRLVPFGEYVPLEKWLRGLIAFFDLPMSGFSPGPANQSALRASGYRVAPFICYEIVYGDLVAKNSRNTDLIVTISNDTWFGDSIGPLQHLQIAQMRGREVGRYVLRGTNNGVSAIIDHQGRVVARSERFVATTLVGEAEAMLGETPFGSFGTTPIIAACALCLILMYLMYIGFWRDTA